ncbi:MAG TPA: histidine kinase, partial [Burkholderiales bacterium]|nr:histidine kinase [Burkholderiales bacterium]
DSPACTAHDPATLHAATEVDCGRVAELAQLLEAKSLVTVPLRSRNQVLGRLHVASGRWLYARSDVEFLVHVAAQVGVMIENMQLLNRLTVEVAKEERKKISRDLHDGTIQPYIGLKLALEALQRRVAGNPVLVHEVDDLVNMASDGISQLRHYVGNLKIAAHDDRRGLLLPAIRLQADKFTEYYGIATEVVGSTDIAVQGALFEEVMYLVREGLSNIRRHTRARTAQIGVDVAAGRLTLRITNDTGPDQPHDGTTFTPRSISERTRELGGNVAVDCSTPGTTAVSIEIPV